MEPGQCSGTKETDGDVWAKLVPTDSSYPVIEIRSQDTIICSEVTPSSIDKSKWCEIKRCPDKDSTMIRSTSLSAIIVDGTVVGEEAVDIKSGSEIISGPDRSGYLSYIFEVILFQQRDSKSLQISIDVEHAKCSICLNLWHDVVTVAPCLHNFCNGCFSEWLRRSSTRSHGKNQSVICPQCRAIVHSVGRNHFLHNIEEAILQTFSSLKRSDEDIALLDTYASIKSNLILGMQKNPPKKRPLTFASDESNDMELPCPQCGAELGGFRCSLTTAHLQCEGCGGRMPSRPESGVLQNCLGCDRAFCGVYWAAQGVDADEFNVICHPDTFKPISQRTISRIPDSTHQNNRYEREITERCIQQTGKTLQAMISDWIVKFVNREIDRTNLQLKHAEKISSRTYLCNDCYNKFIDYLLYWFRVSMSRLLLPRDASERENCWYGYLCRTQHHSDEHARKRNHVCRPTRGSINMHKSFFSVWDKNVSLSVLTLLQPC
ncbi:E3 ubiquitin-protein ligase CHFR isoform X3 [Phoenix dactylifera]|uniref:E3 ubiquitin-protein ligase CHFR isoform X3 n=1 Tax=Phoenix dactylifera TaxID=42345 RepID=A0A8B8J0Z9_PHODC|nr:E3 ubiquitin-protein ligase CHFR isoform X3 [Phoenix dactylifera]